MDAQLTDDPWSRLGALADPVRRRVYRQVAGHDGPIRRDEVAERAGISRALAAYHLDQLVEAGLLTVSFARPSGRGGPGAGRPAKHYAPGGDEFSLSLPPRNYGLLAHILADAMEADAKSLPGPALAAAARQEGRALGGLGLLPALTRAGFEPMSTGAGGVDLRNCPFGSLSAEHTSLVCGLNLELVRGILSGSGDDPARARLQPRASRCCVVVEPDAASAPPSGPGAPA